MCTILHSMIGQLGSSIKVNIKSWFGIKLTLSSTTHPLLTEVERDEKSGGIYPPGGDKS